MARKTQEKQRHDGGIIGLLALLPILVEENLRDLIASLERAGQP